MRTRTLLLEFALVFIASGACTRTFYIDYAAANDSANGTSTATPWKRSPGMVGFAGTYSHQAGDCMIFKGGTTWPASVLPLTPVDNGTAGHMDYFGASFAWYAGGSFTRPVFDYELTNGQAVIMLQNRSYIDLDNLEVKNIKMTGTSFNLALIYCYGASYVTIRNCYLHGWQNTAANDDTKHGAIFNGSNMTITNNELSNAEYGDNGDGLDDLDGVISGNTIHDMPTAMIGVSGTITGNHIYNINTPVADFDAAHHTNVMYVIGQTTVAANYIHDTDAGAAIYPEPCWGGAANSIYLYNNVYAGGTQYGCGGLVCASTEGGTGTCGSVYIYNNTLESTGTYCVRTFSQGGTFAVVDARNNHCINDSTGYSFEAYVSLIDTNNLTQTHANATSQGYVAGNAYGPTDVGDITISAGVNLTSLGIAALDVDRLGVARLSSGAWNAGAYEYSGAPPASSRRIAGTTRVSGRTQ